MFLDCRDIAAAAIDPMRTDGFDVAAVHEVTAAFEKSVHLGRAPLAITGSAGVASPSLRQAAAIGNVYR